MGHKQILLFFNIILLAFIAFVFFLPIGILGWEWTLGYWTRQWYWLVVLLTLVGLSWLLFFLKFRYHTFIEKEDWAGLLQFLEERQKSGIRLSVLEIRLWVLSSLLTRQIQKVVELENFLRLKQPDLWLREGLLFTLPLWLRRDDDELQKRLDFLVNERTRVRDWRWVQWCLALWYSYAGKTAESERLLMPLLKDFSLVGLLSAYLLSRQGNDTPEIEQVKHRWSRLGTDRLNLMWNKNKEEIVFIMFLDGVFENCLQWLKNQETATGVNSNDR